MANIYIIAGSNGSGKTTFAEEFLPKYAHCPIFINADMIAKGLSGFTPDATALKAGRLLLEQIDAFAAKKMDFAFETTLSGVTYLSKIKKLKAMGYKVHLFFLWIPDVKLSLARVAGRVKMGGHNITEKVVRRRFHKGIKNFFQRYRDALDSWMLFDGSGNEPNAIAQVKSGKLTVFNQMQYAKILKITGE